MQKAEAPRSFTLYHLSSEFPWLLDHGKSEYQKTPLVLVSFSSWISPCFSHSFLNGVFGIFSCVTKFLILVYISDVAVQPTDVLLVYLVSLSIDHLLILFPSSLQLWKVMEKNILWLNLHHTHDFFISMGHSSCQWNLGGTLSLQVQSSTVFKFLWAFY